MKESCIRHPNNSYFIKIYDYQMVLFDNNRTVCALISLFESYHNTKIEEANKKIQLGKEVNESDYYQFHSYSELQNRLFHLATEPTIAKGIDILNEKNIVIKIDEERLNKHSNYNSNPILFDSIKRNKSIYLFNDMEFNQLIDQFLESETGKKFYQSHNPLVKNFTTTGKEFYHHHQKILPPLVKNLTTYTRMYQNITRMNYILLVGIHGKIS